MNLNSKFNLNDTFKTSTTNKKKYLINNRKFLKNQQVPLLKQLWIQKYNIYDELSKLPSSIQNAFTKKQNLTLRQIIILMNLHAIPEMTINVIHTKIKQSVKRTAIKILQNKKVIFVSLYYWYDLYQIEKLIEEMLMAP